MALASDFLFLHCKRTDKLDIKSPILKYVLKSYGKERAEDIQNDLDEVTRRRTEVVAVSGGGPSDGAKEILARHISAHTPLTEKPLCSYYRALSVMETRFPISRDGAHAQVAFYWMNAMNPRRKTKQMNIHFEKAAVLFNIAAHLTQSAAQQNKETQSGYKEAMQQFQEAAAVFVQVREVALKVENPKPSDLTADFLMMAEKLMLAQGQECVYWIASKDRKSPLLLSRLAKQASILYAEALSFLANPTVREDLDRSWQDLVQSKSWLFEAFCQHHASEDAKAKEDIAIEIARLDQTVMLLTRLSKGGKFVTALMPNLINELISTTNNRLQKAERDNASVYLTRVPPFNEIPVISGAQLVKLGEVGYLQASNEHIFADLIPEAITKALSRYSEMVDDVIRKLMNKLDGATDDARVKLKQYELPELLDSVTASSPSLLSEALKKDLEDIEQSGGLSYLEDMLEQLNGLKTTVRSDLEKLETDLDEEASQDAQLREQYGQQWATTTSASQTAGFRKLIVSYKDNVVGADNSDRVTQEKLRGNSERFALLSFSALTQNMPKLEAGMVSTTDLEPQTLIANLRNCLEQLNAVSDERTGLEETLKELKNRDNLLPKLVATGVGSQEDLFRAELQKYDEPKHDVEENLKKQGDLFDYLRHALNSFQQTFDIPAWKQRVDEYSKQVHTDMTSFYDVRTNLGEGMRFYMELKSHIDTLKQQITDYILSRGFDRDDRLQLLKAKEKPTGMAAAPGPPRLPEEPPAYTPPPSVPTEPSPYTPPPSLQTEESQYRGPPSVPAEQPVQVTVHSYAGASEGMGPTQPSLRQEVTQPSAPSATYAPQTGYAPRGEAPTLPQQVAMAENPSPYYPPVQHQPPPQQASYYAPYAPQQQTYQQHGVPTGPPQSYYQPQAPQYSQPGAGQLPQYQQGGYYPQGPPSQYQYPPQGQHPYPPPQQGQPPPGHQPPHQGYSQYPPHNYPPYQQ